MTYQKPSNITYTQMCIYIDTHIYSGNYDESLVYQYLYHLTYMLSRKMKYFDHNDDYDHFSLYLASKLYLRLTNSKKPHIKSILNYLKRIIGVQRITWQQEFGIQYYKEGSQLYYFANHDLAQALVDEASIYDHKSYDTIISDINNIIWNHLKKIPFKKNSPEWYNIYISVVLSLTNSITPTIEQIDTLLSATSGTKDHALNNTYKHLRELDPILFHLDESMKSYIKVLVMEVRHAIAAEFSEEYNYYISSEDIMKNLLVNTYTESNPNEY